MQGGSYLRWINCDPVAHELGASTEVVPFRCPLKPLAEIDVRLKHIGFLMQNQSYVRSTSRLSSSTYSDDFNAKSGIHFTFVQLHA